ncbi:MAG: hypothetical protein N4A46_10090 [Schleiferiaceae bacterium]|jgi:heme-degrading monooxygenase HmoA|nr:hypothetical protein [Schleiferiaceae bacterium]
MEIQNKGTIMQMVRLRTKLSMEELLKIANERAPKFRALPGLIQKYYVNLPEPDMYAGVYIWDTKSSLLEFKESELAATIAKSYEALEAPHVEIGDILFALRA